jgi:hypothetical protein
MASQSVFEFGQWDFHVSVEQVIPTRLYCLQAVMLTGAA